MIVENNRVDIVYHYCSLDVFISIIQNATLWLSDILKSNDSQECIWIRDRIKTRIEAYLAKENEKYLKVWETGYQINPTLNSMGAILYVGCFSESADKLSQWRGYADSGAGVAIGISTKCLYSINGKNPYGPHFGKVIYSIEEQDELVKGIVEENINNMQKKGIGHVALELNSNYSLQFPFCKNPSFDEEKEWRIVACTRPENEGIKKDFSGLRFSKAKLRNSNGKLISYLEMDFSQIKNQFVKEIWIGPKAQFSQRDIMNVLLTNGYYCKSSGYSFEEPILIQHSKCSYR